METAWGCLIAVLATLLSGCATQQTVMPDLKISREIPADAAVAWLKKVAAPRQIDDLAACRYNATGIQSRDNKSNIPWNAIHTNPWAGANSFSQSVGSYTVYAADTRDSVIAWVTVSRKEVRDSAGFVFSDHGDECSAFYVRHGTANEARIAEVTKDVERTLSALAALGVVIEQQPPKGTQP